jgi:signal transduction histidine kinase
VMLWAQPPRIEYFTVNDGLSTRDINSLHIGKDGFLWVATMDGLNRFDGQSFLTVGQDPGMETKLSRGAIDAVKADNENGLIVTFQDFFGYFDRLDPRNFSVEQVRLVPSTGILGYPRAIEVDDLGRVFVVTIGTEGTFLYEYTPDNPEQDDQFTVIYHQPNDSWKTFAPRVELLPLSNGQFLLYDEEHGFRHLGATGRLIRRPLQNSVGQRRFYSFAESPDGTVYLSFRDGYPLFRWDAESGNPPAPVAGLDDGLRYPQIFQDELGQLLFLATEDILGELLADEYYLVDTTGRFSLFEEALPTERPIAAMAAISFKETVYVGLREGLGVIERYVNPVRNYLEVGESERFFRNKMRGICEDDRGRVYLLEEDGVIYTMDVGKTVLDTLPLIQWQDSTQLDFRAGTSLIYDAGRRTVWGCGQPTGGEKGGLLFQYGLASGLTRSYALPYSPQVMELGKDRSLFVGVSDPRKVGLLMRFLPESGTFEEVEAANSTVSLSGIKIKALKLLTEGDLLIGTTNRGLLRYQPGSGHLERIKLIDETGVEDLTTEFSVNVIHEDTLGNWWIGTDGGLIQYSTATKVSQRYGRSEGLSSNIVVGIEPDSMGGLWLSTQNGLVHLPQNLDQKPARRYYREDGLSSDRFNTLSHHRDRIGRYYFGSDNGLTIFREADLSVRRAGADVMLTEVSIYGRSADRKINRNLEELRQVTVFASEKSIAISFALPAGQLPSSSQFRYQLEGFNDDWVGLTNERTIRFNNLPAGSYRLRVQGAGANGNFGEKERILNIHVRQYVVEKLWFQIAIILAFAGLIIGILQAKLREKLRNEQLRTQLSSDIHDEVSGLLAGITLQAELLKNRTDDEKMQERLTRVGEAGRNAMSKMSDVIWSIDSRRDTIGNLIQRMQEHADEVLLPLDIRYDFRVTGFDEGRELAGNIRQDVYFIYKEAINNIARHSTASRVDIELSQAAQVFEMFIRDNGRGENAHGQGLTDEQRTRVRAQKTGQGKDNMRMRATRLKADLTIDERSGYTLVLRMRRLA